MMLETGDRGWKAEREAGKEGGRGGGREGGRETEEKSGRFTKHSGYNVDTLQLLKEWPSSNFELPCAAVSS